MKDCYGSRTITDVDVLHELVAGALGITFEAREGLFHGGPYWRSRDQKVLVRYNEVPFDVPEPEEEDFPDMVTLVYVSDGCEVADHQQRLAAIEGLELLYSR